MVYEGVVKKQSLIEVGKERGLLDRSFQTRYCLLYSDAFVWCKNENSTGAQGILPLARICEVKALANTAFEEGGARSSTDSTASTKGVPADLDCRFSITVQALEDAKWSFVLIAVSEGACKLWVDHLNKGMEEMRQRDNHDSDSVFKGRFWKDLVGISVWRARHRNEKVSAAKGALAVRLSKALSVGPTMSPSHKCDYGRETGRAPHMAPKTKQQHKKSMRGSVMMHLPLLMTEHAQGEIYSGYLNKRQNHKVGRRWQKRFFRLRPDLLLYSKSPDGPALGAIPLVCIVHIDNFGVNDHSQLFHLHVVTDLENPEPRIFSLKAPSEKDCHEWVDHLKTANIKLSKTLLAIAAREKEESQREEAVHAEDTLQTLPRGFHGEHGGATATPSTPSMSSPMSSLPSLNRPSDSLLQAFPEEEEDEVEVIIADSDEDDDDDGEEEEEADKEADARSQAELVDDSWASRHLRFLPMAFSKGSRKLTDQLRSHSRNTSRKLTTSFLSSIKQERKTADDDVEEDVEPVELCDIDSAGDIDIPFLQGATTDDLNSLIVLRSKHGF